MALSDMSPADVAALVGDNNDGFGGGSMAWLIIILFLFAGWGNGGYGAGNAATSEAMNIYPILENQQNLFNGFSNLTTAITAGFANAETAATTRQMADMQQEFALSQQLSQCCCDNRLATANLQATLASEACDTRQAVSDGVRDILANQNAGIQRILDKMCDQDLFAERRENESLRQQLAMATLSASQIAQTAQIIDTLKPAAASAA